MFPVLRLFLWTCLTVQVRAVSFRNDFLVTIELNSHKSACIGTLVTPEWVLVPSPRICPDVSIWNKRRVFNLRIGRQKRTVAASLENSEWRYVNLTARPDLTLLKVEPPFRRVLPVPINYGDLLPDCDLFYVQEDAFQEIRLKPLPFLHCSREYGRVQNHTEMCAVLDRNVRVPRGSPLLCNGSLTGVEFNVEEFQSRGKRGERVRLLRFFRIKSYIGWIVDATRHSMKLIRLRSTYEQRMELGNDLWLNSGVVRNLHLNFILFPLLISIK